VSTILRIAAAYSLLWAIVLAWPVPLPVESVAVTPELRAMARGLATANLALAILLWRAARDPRRERWIVYAALLLFGLRAAVGTYEVLYTLDGHAAVLRLIDMVISLAGFTGILNTLPGVLQRDR
jgi:heme A synthase